MKQVTRPPLSIVVATARPWPEMREFLDHARDQARQVGAEIIVVDGHGHGLPGPPEPPVQWMLLPSGSVFELRALGAARATGEIVAFTEDHCHAAPDWCEATLRSHREHPDALAIAGAVANGSPALLDRANFLITFSPYLAPLDEVPDDRLPSSSNISYKRAALPEGPIDPFWLEHWLKRDLVDRGLLVADDRVVVTHVQSHGPLRTFAIHFHAGRSFGAMRWQGLPWGERRRRLREPLRVPRLILSQTRRELRARPGEAAGNACLTLITVLACCHTVGQLSGMVAGAGSSPRHLV